jgi:hypothetical protein
MVAHGGESPTRKANARRHVAHATIRHNFKEMRLTGVTPKSQKLRWRMPKSQ